MTFLSCLLPSTFFFDEICGLENTFFKSVNKRVFSLIRKNSADFRLEKMTSQVRHLHFFMAPYLHSLNVNRARVTFDHWPKV